MWRCVYPYRILSLPLSPAWSVLACLCRESKSTRLHVIAPALKDVDCDSLSSPWGAHSPQCLVSESPRMGRLVGGLSHSSLILHHPSFMRSGKSAVPRAFRVRSGTMPLLIMRITAGGGGGVTIFCESDRILSCTESRLSHTKSARSGTKSDLRRERFEDAKRCRAAD